MHQSRIVIILLFFFIVVVIAGFYLMNHRQDTQSQQMQNEVRLNRQVTLDSRSVYVNYLERIIAQCSTASASPQSVAK